MFHTLSRLVRPRRRSTPNCTDGVSNGLRVGFVDDPVGRVRIVRASGRLGADTITCLFRAWEHITAPHALHLDLHDVVIGDGPTIRRLESALDHLERQQIGIRVVGLDPTHPAIVA